MKHLFIPFLIFAIAAITSCGDQQSPSPQPKTEKKDTAAAIDWEATSVKADEYDADTEEDNLPAQVLKQFPAGYTLLKYSAGDLNKDSLTDWLIALKHHLEDSLSFNEEVQFPRKLLLFIASGKNDFALVAASDSALYCKTCGGMMGDPFMGFTIKNGYFSIENYGGSAWRWSRTVTFRYSLENKHWVLHKDGYQSFHASDPEKIETTISTNKDFGNVLFADFNIYDEN